MTEFHEIKIINTQKNNMIDIIYIHDDFFGYLGEAHPRQIELLNMIIHLINSIILLQKMKRKVILKNYQLY